jgi:PAS domain S-box-containing protein
LGAFCVVVAVLGYASYRQYERDFKAQTWARLEAVAELKARELAAWRFERLADGRYYIDNEAVGDLVTRALGPADDSDAREQLVDLLGRMQANHQYHRIAIHDADGRERLAVPLDAGPDDGHMTEDVSEVLATGQVSFLAIHAPDSDVPHMTVVAPLRSAPTPAAGPATGAVVLRIDAKLSLLPILRAWPVPSETSEVQLVRRSGDSVEYIDTIIAEGLGSPRATASATRSDLPGVRAALGASTTMEAVNRRGTSIVASLVQVPDSPWALVASTAVSELYGPLRERAWLTTIIAVLVIAVTLVGFDVVWRRSQQENAREERERLTTLQAMAQVVEASPVVLFRWRPTAGWPVEWVSANVARWGYTPEALIAGQPPFSGLIHPDDVERVNQEVRQFTADGSDAFVQEYRLRTADGRVLWIDDRTRVVRDADGGVVRYEGTLSDITKRKELQAQFAQAQKMETVGRLAGGVAHDFNNLLTVINGYSEFLLSELPEGDPNREMAQEIHDAGQRASGLTRQLLAFSRRQVVQPVLLDLSDVADQMHKMLQRLIGEDIRLTFDLEPELWRVRADAGQIEQVIMNLVVNARDAMPEGGTLVVTTRNIEGATPEVMMAVADTGCGIDDATRARLFEPFFTTKKAGQGTGLGLATVYGIVNQWGGHIDVASTLGHGATFRLYFPRAVGDDVEHRTATRTGVTPGSGTVLVVEDEEGLRRIADRILTAAGYTVLLAANGEDALELMANDAPSIDLLLTDVVMPGMNGHELAERLRASRPGLKVLFASGYLHDAFPDRGRLGPEIEFLAKPYSPTTLTGRVRDVLDRT